MSRLLRTARQVSWAALVSLTLGSLPARAQDVSLLSTNTRVKLFFNFSGMTVVSTDRPFAPGIPFFLLPESAFGLHTNTFDLHARQTNFGFLFAGPKIKSLTTGATFLAYIARDNLVGDSYGLLPFLAYGELHNEKWRFTFGLNLDVFNPLYPTIIPISILYGSGNTGEYRGQVRMERTFKPSRRFAAEIGVAVGEPVGSVVTDNRRILEDNGWPNAEMRVEFGVGSLKERKGQRRSRPFELGVSGVLGQLRTTGVILSPGEEVSPDREIVEVQGVGVDLQLAFNRWAGLLGELYWGNGLGEYGGGILQSFSNTNFNVIESRGGWGELYVYPYNSLHLHFGYGIDDPDNEDLSRIQITRNQAAYGVLYWDISRIVQLGIEGDYRKTNFFFPLIDAEGFIFMAQMLFRF